MNNKIYTVTHEYDTDGGFGDAVACQDLVATFATLKEAEEFVAKYGRKICYDTPYNYLYCGILTIDEVELGVFDEDDFWWLKKEAIEVDDDDEES